MALKCVYIGGCSKTPRLRAANFHPGNSGLIMSLRYDLEKCRKWECCCLGVLAQKAAIPIEDDKKPTVTGAESSGSITGVQENESKGFLNLLPSSLHAQLRFCDHLVISVLHFSGSKFSEWHLKNNFVIHALSVLFPKNFVVDTPKFLKMLKRVFFTFDQIHMGL